VLILSISILCPKNKLISLLVTGPKGHQFKWSLVRRLLLQT